MESYKRIMEQKYKVRAQHLSIEMLMENGMFVCGGPATVAELLERRQSEMGFGNLVAIQQFATLPQELTEKSLRLFAAEIIPKLRDVGVTAPTENAPAAE